jgi:hypothetical protein
MSAASNSGSERNTDPRTDAETERDAAASPGEQPNGQSDPRTNRDTESRPMRWGHVVATHDEQLPLRTLTDATPLSSA